jgi:gliding motility-associated-like protein
VELYNNEAGNRFLVGDPEVAASFYPEVIPGDNQIRLNVRRNVPWLIDTFLVYRFPGPEGGYELVGSTTEEFYVDENLKNGQNYCYYLVAKGKRDIYNSLYLNENISHRNCGVPVDNEPPCPPDFNVESNCDSSFNRLTWFYRDADLDCSEDVVKFRIYYTPDLSIPYVRIDSIEDISTLEYIHFPEESLGLAASYYITAVDSFNNESARSLIITVDDCIKYTLPNVFSPNGDGINDFFRPIENQDVERVEMQVFNRWGQLVFETEDPEINWNGKHKNSNDLVSPGIYYYICDVFERRISGVEVRNLVGFIHVYHEKGATNADEIEDL